MKCPDCGNSNPPTSDSCEYCGADLRSKGDARKTYMDRSPAPPPPPDASRRRTVFEHNVRSAAPPPAPSPPVSALADPFVEPPGARPVYDPRDPFRAAVQPAAAPASQAVTPPPVPPRPATDARTTTFARPAKEARTLSAVLVSYRKGEDQGTLHPLYLGRNTLGRDDSQDITIADGQVSGQHAFVFVRDDSASFIDLSLNGSLVDGTALHGDKVDIAHGSVIQVGNTTLVYSRLASPPAASTHGMAP